MTTESNTAESPNFGRPEIQKACFYLWEKAANHMTEDELKWFSNLSSEAHIQTSDLAEALESVFCNMLENEDENVSSYIKNFSHQAAAISGMLLIGTSATHRLLHPELYKSNSKAGAQS